MLFFASYTNYFGQCTPGPTANFSFSGGNNTCANTLNPIVNSSTGNGLTYQWDFGNPASGVNNTSSNPNPNHEFITIGDANEIFNVQLIVIDVNGCRDTIIQTITKNQTPELSLIDPNTNFRNCAGGGNFALTVFDFSTLSTNVNHTIIWGDGTGDFNSGGVFPGAGVDHTYVPIGVFDLIYIVQGQNGCRDTLVVPVASTTNPSIGLATLGGTSGCAPLTPCFPITNASSNHSTTFYVVDYGDGSVQDTFSHPPPAQFCHTYLESSCPVSPTGLTVTITATNLCNATIATVNGIQVFTPPVASIATVTETVCVNTLAAFDNASTPGYNSSCSRFTNFTWDWGDGTTTVVNSLTPTGNSHIYTTPGIYEVVLISSNSCGQDTDTAAICVEAAPVPDFTINPAIACIPFNVTTDNLSSTIDVCAVTRNWSTTFDQVTCNPSSGTRSFANGTDAASFEPEFTFSSPGVYSINLSLTNSCGTINQTEQVIAQSPPEISINPVTSICGGETVSPTANYNDCQESIDTYLWNFAGSSSANSNNPVPGSVTYNTNGAFTITLTATNACGNDVATTSLTVNDVPPELNPFTISPLCAGYDAEFISDNVLNATYNWTGPNGFTSNLQNPIIPNVDPTDAGTYSVYASFGTCEGLTESVELIILPITVVQAGNDVENCLDDDPFTLIPTTPPGGTWSGNGINAAGLFTPNIAGAGVHTLTYTFTDPITNCVYSDDLLATVNGLPIVQAGGDLSLCNQPIANQLTPITPLNGVWSGPGITDPAGEFTPSVNGVFEILYSFTDGNGCFNQDTIEITVIAPTIADAGLDSTICVNGNNIQLTGLPIGGTWTGSGVTNLGDFDPTVVGTFTLTYSFGSGTCQSDDEMDVIVNPAPNVDAGNDFTICLDGGDFDLTTNPNLLGGTWSGTGITDVNGVFDPLVAGNGAHILTYLYTDPLTNCSNTDFITANVNPLPVVNAGNDTTICNQPLPIQFVGTPAGGTWSGTNIDASGVFTPTGTGVFTLYYGFNLSGCSAIDSLDLTIVDPTLANAGSDLEFCLSNTQTQFVGAPIGGTWTGSGVASNGDFTPNTSGTFEMVFSFGGGNCLTRDTMEVIVFDLPVVDAGVDVEFCESDLAVNFIGSPLGGSWSGSGIVNSAFGTFDPSAANNNGLANVITYTFTDNNNCTNTDDLDAIVHELPTVLFTYNPIVCVGVSESFTSNSLLGDQFQWNFGDNTALNLNENPNHTYTNTGFFDIQLIVETQFGCLDSLSQQIEVRELPTANFSILPDSACGPLNANFTNLSSGIGNLSYDWDFGNGQNSALQNPPVVVYPAGILADTSYYITLDVTGFCGTVSKLDSVKVMPKPLAIFGPLFNTGCSPFTAEFANISVGLPDNYAWDFGNGVTSNISDPLFSQVFVTGALDTTYTIRLIVSNECGADTAFHDIHIFPTSVNSFFNTNITEGCAPLSVDFTSISAGATQFNWDFDDGNVSTQATVSNTFTAAGTYSIRLIVNDACSRDTSFATITVHPQPNIDFSFTPASACTNTPFFFTNLSTGVSNLAWDFGDGGVSGLSNPSHSFANPGIFPVTLTGTSTVFACQSSVVHNVTVVSSPDADYTINPNNGCIPSTVVFNNSSTNFTFVTWDFGDGNSSSIANPAHTYTAAGNFTVKLIVENNIGCKDSITSVVQAFPVPDADFDFIAVDSCNIPSQVLTTNLSVGGTSYAWNMGNGFTSILTNPSVFYSNPGTYFIKLVATNQYGCKDSLIKDITIFQPPTANFIIADYDLCEGDLVVGTSVSSQADSVKWFMGDGTVLYGNVINYEYEFSGEYLITVVAFGEGSCSDTLFSAQPVVVQLTPHANFSYENIEENELTNGLVQFTNLSSNSNSYLWVFEQDSLSTVVNPSYQFDHYGDEIVTLYAYNINGCYDSIFKIVTVDYFRGLYVPNAMYPAHPTFEVSHFIPKGVGLYTYRLTIYDDWGNLIFETTKLDDNGRPTEAWDATFNGVPVQQDAYVWKIEATYLTAEIWDGKQYPDGRFKRAGTITVIR